MNKLELLKTIIIDLKPLSLNQLYLKNMKGRTWLNPKQIPFRNEMIKFSNNELYDFKLYLDIIIYMDRVTSSDYDNPLKALNDALENSGIIKNDSFIYKATIEKRHSKRRYNKTIIKIYKFEEDQIKLFNEKHMELKEIKNTIIKINESSKKNIKPILEEVIRLIKLAIENDGKL